LVFSRGTETFEIDSRTSDALALAVRFECPIYVEASILEEAGVEADPNEEATANEDDLEKKIEELTSVVAKPNSPLDFGSMNLEELNHELLRAIEDEDYERAARIRDELNKKK
jgi:hypothetical protein